MLKRVLIFLFLIFLTVTLWVQGRELMLNYYVLSSLLVFPLFHLYAEHARSLFRAGLALYLLTAVYFFMRQPGLSFLILSAGQIGLFAGFVFYVKGWQMRLFEHGRENEGLLRDWEHLKQKHSHRLENLQNLEKQVASLIDLFEIARDFSECLRIEALVDLLYKRVMPELPFRCMRLILPAVPEGGETPGARRIFTIHAGGVEEGRVEFTHEEKRLLEVSSETRQSERSEDLWLFPMISENDIIAHLSVEGAEQKDLAKYEVLVAHLVLQIKKISLYNTVKELSIVDGLTQVFVRRHFRELFEGELKRSIKHKLSLALLMLDIDHFKRYNDDFGHLVGDATLRELAGILRQSLRKVDIVARFGGEEFVIVIPESKSEGAVEVAERIRSNIARHVFKAYQATTRVTVSIGISIFPDNATAQFRSQFVEELPLELIRKADIALYRAKEEGRNRIIQFNDLSK